MRRMTFGERMNLGLKLWGYFLILMGVGGLLMIVGAAITVNPEVAGFLRSFLGIAPALGIACIILATIAYVASMKVEKNGRGR